MISSTNDTGHYLVMQDSFDIRKMEILLETDTCSTCNSEFEVDTKVYYVLFTSEINVDSPICENCVNKKIMTQGLSN